MYATTPEFSKRIFDPGGTGLVKHSAREDRMTYGAAAAAAAARREADRVTAGMVEEVV